MNLSIRPLQTAEIRARTLAGSYQISGDGRHLIDGIPFGRPYLRTPNRPALYIPPRKKRRITTEAEDDDTLVPKALTYQDTNSVADLSDEDGELQAHVGRRSKGRRVSFSGVAEEVDSQALMALGNGTEDDESQEYDPGSDELDAADDDDDDEDDSDSDSDSDPDSDSDFDTESEDEEESVTGLGGNHVSRPPARKHNVSNGFNKVSVGADLSDSSPSSSESDDSESNSAGDDEDNPRPEERSSAEEKRLREVHDARMKEHELLLKEQEARVMKSEASEDGKMPRVTREDTERKPRVPPGAGKSTTRARNERKRLQKKMSGLKRDGLLPLTATLEDVRNYYASDEVQKADRHHHNDTDAQANEGLVERVAEGLENDESVALAASAGSKKSSDTTGTLVGDNTVLSNGEDTITHREEDPFSGFKQLLQEKSKEISASEGVDISQTSIDEQSMEATTIDQAEPESKRARLDMAASKRHIFSALGVRAPKSKAEEEKVMQKLAGTEKRKTVVAAVPNPTPQEAQTAPQDPELWRTKVTVSAIECLDGDVTLSAPPFPFKQRWHQQQRDDPQRTPQTHQQKRNSTVHKKKKRSTGFDFGLHIPQFAHNSEAEEENHHNMSDTNGDAFTLRDACDADDDDLPNLPTDPTTLSVFTAADAKPKTVIAFKQLEVSAATGWVPQVSDWRTAIIDEAMDGGHTLHVTLARRDRPRQRSRTYDQEGKRLYDGFEMPGYESENEDDGEDQEGGKIMLSKHELSEARLVRAAMDESTESVHTAHADDANGVSLDPLIESETLREAPIGGDDIQ